MGKSVTISLATAEDAEHILKLQYLCYQEEAELYGDWTIAPLTQTLDSLRTELADHCAVVARLGDEVVGAVRGRVDDARVAHIGRLVVHPRMQRHGLGGRLLHAVEGQLMAAGPAIDAYRLGYQEVDVEEVNSRLTLVTLEKPALPASSSAETLAASA
jgi:ribosomal protein S18 acetylase RimI-like enzyme